MTDRGRGVMYAPPVPATKKRKGPGRPPRAGKSASETRFEIRLTDIERAKWQRAADRKGLTLAELIREAVEAAIQRSETT